MSDDIQPPRRVSDVELKELKFQLQEHIAYTKTMDQELSDAQDITNEKLQALADSQKVTNEKLEKLIEDTRAAVRVTNDIQGAARIGISIQAFIMWLMKTGGVAIFFATAIIFAVDYIKKKF